MSRPRFLADNDLTEAIPCGLMRREPSIEFRRLRELGMASRSDAQVLEYAAAEGLVIVSHDVNTMTGQASSRIGAGLPMPGVFLVHQGDPVGAVIEDLLLVWAASEAEEWANRLVFLPLR